LEEFEKDLTEVVLIPSRGGVFEVELDGDLIFSKKQTGRHGEYDHILKDLRARIR
jgi:selenoprotein W-related protein